MELVANWGQIKQVFDAAAQSSHHFSVATVDASGNPHITPIGSLFLRDDCTGFYFESFPQQLPDNLNQNQRVTILALNSDRTFWFEAISSGQFGAYPGMRLMGTALKKRAATEDEINAWQQKVAYAKGLKGHDILWKDMRTVRDIKFDGCKPVLCGEMTAGLDPK